MQLNVTTWNINSVRLRIDLVAKFIKAVRPDVLCLQETKCPDDAFPLKRFKRLGYEHIALNGQKGYHGVAVISRLPFETSDVQGYCGKTDCRHVSRGARRAGRPARSADAAQFLRAGRRRRARPGDQSEIRPQARVPRRDARLREPAAGGDRARHPGRRSQRRAARARRLEPQADAQGGVAHADRMREAHRARRRPATGSTSMRVLVPEPEKLYTWWSYRSPDWATADGAAGSTTSGSRRRSATGVAGITIAQGARGWERPSDHVPVTVDAGGLRSRAACRSIDASLASSTRAAHRYISLRD